jgi:hypothetical protein
MKINRFSHHITVFHERPAPEPGFLVGYGAIHKAFDLQAPLPDMLALISEKHKQYKINEWRVFTPRHMPEDTLKGHLRFALKYEGIELGILKKLFEKLEAKKLVEWITEEPTGLYNRKVWCLYEWLMDTQLEVGDLTTGNYIDLVDEKLQYATQQPLTMKRQRIRNNLPGVKDFCPMIRKTALLEEYIRLDLSQRIKKIIGKIHPDVMARTAAFLLLKDSKASYAIEGERPPQNRAQRWGRAIGQAGQSPISEEELIRLQQIVIDNPRFIQMGFRHQEGFVGEHDRRHGTPIPDHISAKWEDLELLMDGLLATCQKLEEDPLFDAVLAAAASSFGFVFIHPFVDCNGRIHRSHPRLDLIDWKPTADNNVKVLNNTIDLYRYFDATKQVEFLYSCVQQTIEQTIPNEVDYLEKYDRMKEYLDNTFEMPDSLVALFVQFLNQGNGQLSQRARTKEFKDLNDQEVSAVEKKYQQIFQ